MKNNLTKWQKFIASALRPFADGNVTRSELNKAKALARGKYWYDSEFESWVAFSPGGKRQFFDLGATYYYSAQVPDFILQIHNNYQKCLAKECAKLWSAGKCAQAQKLEAAICDLGLQ
jgi:hypothetical protein